MYDKCGKIRWHLRKTGIERDSWVTLECGVIATTCEGGTTVWDIILCYIPLRLDLSEATYGGNARGNIDTVFDLTRQSLAQQTSNRETMHACASVQVRVCVRDCSNTLRPGSASS